MIYEDKDMYTKKKYLDYIPDDYSGELSEDIKAFKLEFVPEYEEFLKEEERKAEELRIESEKREREFINSLANKIPYEGMSEKYIDCTAA